MDQKWLALRMRVLHTHTRTPGLPGLSKVAGHVAANFFIPNSFSPLMLQRNFRVGGQLAAIPEN